MVHQEKEGVESKASEVDRLLQDPHDALTIMFTLLERRVSPTYAELKNKVLRAERAINSVASWFIKMFPDLNLNINRDTKYEGNDMIFVLNIKIVVPEGKLLLEKMIKEALKARTAALEETLKDISPAPSPVLRALPAPGPGAASINAFLRALEHEPDTGFDGDAEEGPGPISGDAPGGDSEAGEGEAGNRKRGRRRRVARGGAEEGGG